jgi:glutathione S-transferase
MLTIHGRINSINVQKVALACEELKLPYKRIDAGGAFGIVQTAEYKAMNPNGLVPVLVDDGFVLWESNTIVRYLAAKYGEGTFWQTDPAARALSDRWMDWASVSFYPKLHSAFWGLVRTPPDKRDHAAIEASIDATDQALDILEAELDSKLSDGKLFLAGHTPTIGDIALVPAIFRWLNMPVQRKPKPHTEAWCARMANRPGYGNALILPIT